MPQKVDKQRGKHIVLYQYQSFYDLINYEGKAGGFYTIDLNIKQIAFRSYITIIEKVRSWSED